MTKTLEERGGVSVYDWTTDDSLSILRPYDEHCDAATKFAKEEVGAMQNVDVFIILGDIGGTGMYVEMGAALAGRAKIYAVGECNDATIFHYHPRVARMDSFNDVLEDLSL